MIQRRIRLALRGVPRARQLHVRSEDVLNESERTLPMLAGAIGLNKTTQVLRAMDHAERSPDAALGGVNDPGFFSDPRVRTLFAPGSRGTPWEWTISRNTEKALQLLAAHYAFAVDGAVPGTT